MQRVRVLCLQRRHDPLPLSNFAAFITGYIPVIAKKCVGVILKKNKKVHAFLKQASAILNKNLVSGLPRKTQESSLFFLKHGVCFSRNDYNHAFMIKLIFIFYFLKKFFKKKTK